MALFDNGELGDFLWFIRNSNMTLEAPGTLRSGANIQYLCTLLRGEALRQFDILSSEVGSTTPENLTSTILDLGTQFYPVNSLSKKIVQFTVEQVSQEV